MALTWDPATKNAAIALSVGNSTATSSAGSGSVNAGVIGTVAISATVKQYFEVTVSAGANQYFSVGVMNGSASLSANLGATNGAAWVNRLSTTVSNVYRNGTNFVGPAYPLLSVGQVIRVAIDRASNKMWWAVNTVTWGAGNTWMDGAGTFSDPATNTGGLDISAVTGTIYPAFSSAWTGDVAVINGGAAGFAYSAPTGFTAIDPPAAVVLLVHCDGANGSTSFIDASPSGHPLQVSGATVSTAQAKFGTGSAYVGASTANKVFVTSTLSDFDFQSTPFTIEAWAYASSAPGVSSIVSQFNFTSTGGWFFGAVSGNLAFWCYNGSGTLVQLSPSTPITTGAWHHYAVDRDAGGTVRLYLDGAVVSSASVPTFISAAVTVNIGGSNRSGDGWPGYIDEVRINKGTALYAGAFTPSTIPFTPANPVGNSGTVLICHCDGTNGSTTFTDASPNPRTLTAISGATVSTAQAKFGTGSASFVGASLNAIQIGAPHNDFNFKSSPFTIEAWAYASSSPTTASIVAQWDTSSSGGWFFGPIFNALSFYCMDAAGSQIAFSSGTVAVVGSWHHYAVDRDAGGTLRLYLDGVVIASTSAPTFFDAAPQTNIGNSNRGTVDAWPGYIDEVRITKGTARYAGAFTPPTAPFNNFATFDSGQLVNTTLDSTSLIATATGVGGARAQGTHNSGKWYFEFTCTTMANSSSDVGIGTAGASYSTPATQPLNAIAVYRGGFVYNNGVYTGTNIGAVVTGSLVCVAIDLDASLAWFRLGAAGNWNASASNNPATGVGGISIAAWGRGGPATNFYPFASFGASTEQTTANFGASTFAGAVPAGFTSGWTVAAAANNAVATTIGAEVWSTGTPAIRATMLGAEIWSPAPANITFDPTNLSVNMALSNFNLTATSGGIQTYVYGTSGQASGKYYFEYTLGSTPNATDQHGLALVAVPGNASPNLGIYLGINSTTAVTVSTTGGLVLINAGTFGAVPTMGLGTVIGVAVDFDNQAIWFRVAGGQWNGGVNGNPATNTGSASFAALGAKGVSLTPRVFFNSTGTRSISLNSGDSGAFAGAVPAGFTSGFPKGGPGNTNALFTQVGAEVWRVAPSDARFTQVGAEVWTSVANAVSTGRKRRVVTISG